MNEIKILEQQIEKKGFFRDFQKGPNFFHRSLSFQIIQLDFDPSYHNG